MQLHVQLVWQQKVASPFVPSIHHFYNVDMIRYIGAFDITYMACLPNMVVMAPSDEAELMQMFATAAARDDRPSCFRFSRGNGIGASSPSNNNGTPLEVSKRKGRIPVIQQCLQAAQMLKPLYFSVTVAGARFRKPLDTDLIKPLASILDEPRKHGLPQDQKEEAGLSSKNIAATVLSLLKGQ
ncbi:unnamed protein product [Sphenostylis stenocarpa]|uniref:1-deoxy-D-xylulose-5-phosphate synthase n=1 Tax=Sphenostylis stenocarpa TaxID=92480 RepID=A0AA86VDR7_9FABA|nr:unnamed protein product [Sphenostylis stenocarpa]